MCVEQQNLFGSVFANCSDTADVPFHNLAFKAGRKLVSKLSRLSESRTNFSINPFAAKFHLEDHTFKTCNNLILKTLYKVVESNKILKVLKVYKCKLFRSDRNTLAELLNPHLVQYHYLRKRIVRIRII